MSEQKLKIGITQGDTNGIGWEVILKALADPRMTELFTPVVYGSPKAAAYYRNTLAQTEPVQFNAVTSARDARRGKVNLVACGDTEQIEPGKASAEAGRAAVEALRRALKEDFGIVEPRIAVMALNPHAGDGGLLGREEQEIIRPAVVEAFNQGVLAFGPFAADGLFAGGGYAKYDGILAMYHDQGLAPFKTLSPDGVNFTAGLSKVRTSPDHGTAYDIAGQDKADPQSMRSAIYAAIDIVEHRRAWAEWSRNPLQRAEREKGGRDVSVKDLPQTEKED